MSFTAICPDCKFYTPAEEGQKFLSQKKYLTWFNVFRGLLPVCLFHILQQETLKVHISAIQMSTLLQHQALKSIAHRAHCSWILSSHFQVKLTALETGEAQNLSGPEIVGGSIFANQIPGCAARWWASLFHSGAVQCVSCSIWSLMKYAVQPLSAFKTILHISNRRPHKLHLYCTMCFLQYLQFNEVHNAAYISLMLFLLVICHINNRRKYLTTQVALVPCVSCSICSSMKYAAQPLSAAPAEVLKEGLPQ